MIFLLLQRPVILRPSSRVQVQNPQKKKGFHEYERKAGVCERLPESRGRSGQCLRTVDLRASFNNRPGMSGHDLGLCQLEDFLQSGCFENRGSRSVPQMALGLTERFHPATVLGKASVVWVFASSMPKLQLGHGI